MNSEAFCLEHGTYNSTLASCPYCIQEKGGRPPAPTPLDDEATVGKFGRRQASPGQAYSDDDDTILPGHVGAPFGDDDATIPPRREHARYGPDDDITLPPLRRGSRILDEDAIEETWIPKHEDISPLGWLIVKSSPSLQRGHFMKIRSGTIYGRHPRKADVIIDDGKVSEIHSRILIKEDQFVLLDLGSSHGTWLNGEEITKQMDIKENDEIKIGDTVFVLKILK